MAFAALLALLAAPGTAAKGSAPDFEVAAAEGIGFLQELIRIDTSNPPGNETEVARWIQAVLERAGIASEIFALEAERGNLVARLEGNGSKRPLLLMAHTDVVGVARDQWSVDPFAGELKDGYVWGRGATDDKGMLAVILEVILMLHRQGVELDRDVILLAEAGEEGTTYVGIDFMVEHHWDAIDSEFALNEGGGIRKVGDRIEVVSVATTEKVPWRGVRLIARGTAGHGSAPRLDNPVVHLAAAVAKLGDWQPPARLNETTRMYFERMAQISPPELAFLYRHIEDPALTEMVQEKLRHVDISSNSAIRTSISPNMIEGGFRVNVIPAEAQAVLDIRALPDEDPVAFLAMLQEVIDDPLVEITAPVSSRPAAPPSALDSVLFVALERVQQKMFPDAVTVPTMLVAATDSAQLRAMGVQAYGIGAVLESGDRRAHGNDERMPIDGFGQFLEYVYRVVIDVAASD